MELRAYWAILRRRLWIPFALAALVLGLSLLQMRPWQPKAPNFGASMRLLVGVMPASDAATTTFYDPRYYAWLSSEYLVDDFTEVVRSALFAERVSARLAGANLTVPAGAIQGSAATGKQHRIITLSFAWPDAEQLRLIADAAASELSENATFYFQQLGNDGAGITVIDPPGVAPIGGGVRDQVELPLRVALGFLVGVGIVFLLHYLDDSVRRRADLEALGLTVLGEIPVQRKGR